MEISPRPAPQHEMLPLAVLARRLDVPLTSLRRIVLAGELKPDAVAGRVLLWDASRISQVRSLLKKLIGRKDQSAPRGDSAT